MSVVNPEVPAEVVASPKTLDSQVTVTVPDNVVDESKEMKDIKDGLNNETALTFDKEAASELAATDIPEEHKKRPKEYGLTLPQFTINITKSALGLSAFAVPIAMSKVGIVIGLLFYLFVCWAYYYCSVILLKIKNYYVAKPTHNYNAKKTKSEYALFSYALLGDFGYYAITICLLITLWGCNVGTMIILTDFTTQLPWSQIGVTLPESDIRLYACILMTILGIMFLLLKDTTQLVCISGFGLFALILSFIILFISGGMSYGISVNASNLWPVSFESVVSNLGIFISSTSFTFMLFPLYNDMRMRVRSKVNTGIAVSMTSLCVIYLVTGIPLFLIFQNDPNGIQGNIAKNLDPNSIMSVIICIAMIISCLGNYPLQFLGILEITEANISNPTCNKVFITDYKRILSRVCQAIIVSIISFFVPSFDTVFSLIGAFTISFCSLIFPILLNVIWSYKTKNPLSKIELIGDYILIVIFTIIMVICTYSSVRDLVIYYSK